MSTVTTRWIDDNEGGRTAVYVSGSYVGSVDRSGEVRDDRGRLVGHWRTTTAAISALVARYTRQPGRDPERP